MAQTVKLRKSILPLLLGTAEKEKPVAFVEDAAVPPEKLEEFVVRFEEIVEENGTWACFYGHASVGTLHVRPALDTSDPEGVDRMRRIAEEVAGLVDELGGSISGSTATASRARSFWRRCTDRNSCAPSGRSSGPGTRRG
jgi:FAD/FMN-containing dehydrogenase